MIDYFPSSKKESVRTNAMHFGTSMYHTDKKTWLQNSLNIEKVVLQERIHK